MRGSLNPSLPFDQPRRLPPLQPALRPLPGQNYTRTGILTIPLWAILIAGYTTFGRSFSYIGVPPVFIGELYIAWWIFSGPDNWLTRFVDDCMHFKLLPTMILLVIAWGLFDVFRPLFEGKHDAAETLRTFAFDYYPILLIVGIEIGRRITFDYFVQFWKAYSLYFVIYSVFLMGGADSWPIALPWKADCSLFNLPTTGAGFVGVGTLALWPHLGNWRWRWIVLALSTTPVFVSPGRGTFLALLLGIAIVGIWAPRRIVLIAGASAGVVVLLLILSLIIPAQKGRATSVDPVISLARVRATFDPKGAYLMMRHDGYIEEAENMKIADGTVAWRETIWTNAIRSLNTGVLVFAGQGHGASVKELTPDNQELHTPHNFVIYCLYYTGAVGLALFCLLIMALLLGTQRIQQTDLRAMMLAQIVMTVMMAAVGNIFETPFAAIPFYLVAGIGMGLKDAMPTPISGAFPAILNSHPLGQRFGNIGGAGSA